MGDVNSICSIGDYSKPSHEGYRNTIGLSVGNNVVPLRSDTIRLVQNGCSFHGLRSEDPNQHLKDFLKLVDSLDLDGSITTWEDLTTRFLAQFFPPGRTAKLRNDILMFQQHHGESLSEAWTRFKDLLQKVPHHGIDLWLQHRINEKLIEWLVDNHRFNDSLSGTRVGKIKGRTYNLLPTGPVYEAILRKKITRKEDIEGNFEIPCNIGGLKHMNALVDQGSDVKVMRLSTYMKLTYKRPAGTDIRLSLASHSYIYPLGMAEDILIEVAEHVYPVDFVILDIKEKEKRPFILGTPFLIMAKAVIKFDKGTITLRSRKSKISFHRILESLCKDEKGIKMI
ncbi:zinc finger, CCHC-type containing protein [Tanacetum coccineum]